jgi:hypothetical protein
MKKINLTLLVLFIGFSSMAQYKKASYFGKDGRTYSLGTRWYALGDGVGTHMGYSLSLGNDVEAKQWFYGWGIQYLPSYNFNLDAIKWDGTSYSVIGTTTSALIFEYNLGYFLLNNEKAERKIKPYLAGAFGLKFTGGVKETTDDDPDAEAPGFGLGLSGGGGLFYYFTQRFGIQAEGGYNYQIKFNAEQKYNVFPSHTYVRAGLVFRIRE